MPIDFNEIQLHDPENPDPAAAQEVRDLLGGIQGNILKGHGRDHTLHIFVKFDAADSNDLRQKLADVAAGIVTSALQQHVETRQYKDFRIPGAIFGNVFLTAGGYRALGLAEAELGAVLPDPLFLKGMHSETSFNDPPPAKWEKGYRDGEIDAMFLLADDDRDYLQRQGRDLINQLDKFCRICAVEQGDALRNKENNEGIEHFGYVDGRSQPIYLKGDEEKEGTMNKWNPIEPLSLVLAADALAGSGHWGSYFVFRKLEQDVLSFKTREQKLADELGFVTEEERERAGAMAVGRFEDGTPVVLSPNDGYIPLKENDFDYGVDDERPDPNDPAKIIPGGLKCPYHAHIRKTNPRGDTVRKFKIDERLERAHRITRRGITYGQRKKHPNDAEALADYPTKGVGLLFMCFQASIENQFAFMQRSWANHNDFVNGATGLDPIIGQGAGDEQKWRPHYGHETKASNPEDENEREFSFEGFVTMKGGEFFFAPSMEFLRTFTPV